jgi:hypothetical protein
MSSYVKPQVLVFQEFSIVPTEITEPLRAHVSGPHAVLHRHGDADEKPFCRLGAYDYLNDTCYPWPQRLPGSNVDETYTKLYIDDALLLFYEHILGDTSTTITAVSGRTNWIQSSDLSFKSNGAAYPRSSIFNDRDVQLGDVVYLRAVDTESCEEKELWTSVTGFASELVASQIEDAAADDDNQDTIASTTATITKIGGPDNCIVATVDASEYDGLVDGDVEEEYTIEVIKSSVVGCNAARLRVRSASGNDDVIEVTPEDWGTPTVIGSRGLEVTFDYDPDAGCSASAEEDAVDPDVLVTGQKWRVVVSQAFDKVEATSGGDGYDGDKNDVYIVECTKGGLFDISSETGFPEITVRTVKGLDYSGPTEIVDHNVAVAIGSNGVTIKFHGEDEGDAVDGLRKGDRWYINVESSKAGPVRRLILRDDLPTEIVDAADVEMRLFIKDNIQVSENRVGFAPLKNYAQEATQVCVHEGIVAYHPEWTDGGVEQPLDVRGGTLYVEYREWLSELADEVNSVQSVAELDKIKGQLHPDNPLKWGVYKALSNSNGTVVKYTAVTEPADLDSWVQVLERIKGRDDMYNLVPLTYDTRVHNLYAAHIGGESNEYANNWKAGFFALQAVTSKLLVGEGARITGVAGLTMPEPVLATLSDDPNATNTQYTLLQVSAGSGYFITNEVQPGDLVRYLYTVDGFGEEQYQEFVVDQVLSENSLLLFSGADAPVTVAQRVEIHHNLNRNEIADDIAERAGALSNRRVCAVWPDQVGEAGTLMAGYFLAAALAGLASGVVPQQGLTNVEVAGFDDFTRSYKYFNETQLNRMAEAGVWIVTEDRDGTPHTRHALTTDNLDLNRREEMIRRNVDSISYLFLRRLRPYIGRTNATPTMVRKLEYEVTKIIDFFKTNGNTLELGSQLIDGTIRTLRIHPLLRDRIEIVLDLVVPAPLNNIELHLVV